MIRTRYVVTLPGIVAFAGVFFFVGWIWSAGYFAVHHGWDTKNALVSQVRCEDHRADVSAKIAKQAIRGALVDSAPIPDARSIPKDCPHAATK